MPAAAILEALVGVSGAPVIAALAHTDRELVAFGPSGPDVLPLIAPGHTSLSRGTSLLGTVIHLDLVDAKWTPALPDVAILEPEPNHWTVLRTLTALAAEQHPRVVAVKRAAWVDADRDAYPPGSVVPDAARHPSDYADPDNPTWRFAIQRGGVGNGMAAAVKEFAEASGLALLPLTSTDGHEIDVLLEPSLLAVVLTAVGFDGGEEHAGDQTADVGDEWGSGAQLANPEFGSWPPRVRASRSGVRQLCTGWFAQLPTTGAAARVTFRAADEKAGRGLLVVAPQICPSIRIWQPVNEEALRLKARTKLRVTLADVTTSGLAISSVRLYQVNGDRLGAPVATLYEGAAGSMRWHDIEMDFLPVDGITPGDHIGLALELRGRGELALTGCEIVTEDGSPVAGGEVRPIRSATPTARPVPVRPPRSSPANGRLAVVGWDLGHNPAGRSFLLADMAAVHFDAQLVGPLFPQYGGTVWPPIAQQSTIPIDAFPAHDLKSLLDGAEQLASRVQCDAAYVSKPRLPALLAATLIAEANDCPLIVDVDDREMSFFPEAPPLSLADLKRGGPTVIDSLHTPYSAEWTNVGESLVQHASAVTVSNIALQHMFGGTIVRHGRDEIVFDPEHYDRQATRAEFGYDDHDRVILFLGTPRPHKGVFDIADALERVNDDRVALCVIGSIHDKRVASRFDQYKRARIDLYPDQPWSRLAELVGMADAVMILQDPSSAISQHQIPAKLTDALAMGVPVYVTPVPPLQDLVDAGTVRPVDGPDEIAHVVRELAESGPYVATDRDHYLGEFSYEVNAQRIADVFAEATSSTADLAMLGETVDYVRRLVGRASKRPTAQRAAAQGTRKRTRGRKTQIPDLVYVWKQNDSDIYGRRPDMLAKHLLSTGRVRRILHFDAPITRQGLEAHLPKIGSDVAHQGAVVYTQTVRRVLQQVDDPDFFRRTFVHRAGEAADTFLRRDLPSRTRYADFVRASMAAVQISDNPILLVSPVVFDYAVLREAVGPSLVIADIVDDQRTMPARPEYRERLHLAYDEILSDADIVLANCEPVREGFASTRQDIHVIPNAAERFTGTAGWEVPPDLAKLPRPLLGYVGNLRDRVDTELLAKVAQALPAASIVLIGSAHGTSIVSDFAHLPNVHFLGVRPYEEAVRYINAFDVALMPHKANEVSRHMNPLKLYVYASLGVPVVATRVANIDELRDLVTVTDDAAGFLREVSRLAEDPGAHRRRTEIPHEHTWESRIDQLWDLVEPALKHAS